MRRLQILTLILVLLAGTASSQILRYRVSANSSLVIQETGQGEIINPQSEFSEYPSATDFSPVLKLGADIEVMVPVTSHFEVGAEFEYGNIAGRTETPLLYNFWHFDWINPIQPVTLEPGNTLGYQIQNEVVYPSEPIIYETTQLSILGTTRFYFLPSRSPVNFFLKAFGGIAFVGTDLKFHDPYYRIEYDVGYLFSHGTKNSQRQKDKAFHVGGGLGGHYKITERVAIYLEANVSHIASDLMNGVPDFNYIGGTGLDYKPAEGVGALAGQISLGLVYSAIPDQRLNTGNSTKSRRLMKKRTWKKKRKNPFKKRKFKR